MEKRRSLIFMILLLAVAALPWAVDLGHAGPGLGIFADGTPGNPTFYANSPSGNWVDFNNVTHNSGTAMRKFVDPLPGIGGPTAGIPAPGANNIPLAIASTPYGTPYADADYYEIAIVEYTQQMHSDLPKPTRLRGYVQLVPAVWSGTDALGNSYTAVKLTNLDGSDLIRNGVTYYGVTQPRYLGPVILATRGKPVRIKYTNLLPVGVDVNGNLMGNLFIPTDHSLMGAGLGPDSINEYTENRIAIHLHGGHVGWVSDGTPHQWTVPVGETAATWMQGASFQNVPDMENPGQGSGTLYYTNDQASRLMFYHDHAYGITRLNVYAGIAAGYLLQDQPLTGEWTLPDVNTMTQIPLVIQDKTFVPQDIATQDAKWNVDFLGNPVTAWGAYGDLWFPHVYETNQDPLSVDGTNPVGRWDWGPWFWPVFPSQFPLPTGYVGDVSTTPESFMDTPVVNGIAYPTLTVDPKAYRFRILNAANDRFFNLGLYVAEPLTVALTNGGAGYPQPTPPAFGLDVTFTNAPGDTTGGGAAAYATVSTGTVTAINLTNMGQGYTTTPTVTITPAAGDTTGAGATATAIVGNVGTKTGVITGIVVTNPGSGYTLKPSVTIDVCLACPIPTTAATADAVWAPAGEITGITVTNPGTNYTAPPSVSIPGGTTLATAYATLGTEVKMVPFDSAGAFPTTGGLMGTGWGQPDGRAGGVPDPTTAGPDIIQIGSEGGLLPEPVIIPSTPINYEYNRRSVTVLNVLEHGLYLGCAERADAVIDFCNYAGQTLILYNDAPAPVPANDPRIDYYTDGPDQSAFGGMASTKAGYGPNTRTIMQIKVTGTPGSCTTPYDPAALYTALPAAYGSTQDKPIVGESVYNAAFPAIPSGDNYAKIYTGTLREPVFTYTDVNGVQGVAGLSLTAGGANYTVAPAVTISAPPAGGLPALASASFSLTTVTVTNGGRNYTSIPKVVISAPPIGGVQATAVATIGTSGPTRGRVTSVTITNLPSPLPIPTTGNRGYTTAPMITFVGGGGTGATAVPRGVVTGLKLTTHGYGYTANPTVSFSGGGGTGAAATATGLSSTVSRPVLNKAIQELFEPVYGRMNATLGVELPFTSAITQTTIPLSFIDPATETMNDGEIQFWKITHNGVDTHPVHFHLVNVQVVNRVGWDGTVKPPHPNEVGWKETVKMNPLEDIFVAVRAVKPQFNFGLPESIRPLAPSEPIGSTAGFTQVNPNTGNPMLVANAVANFGWEYVWHCHILGHEENDFMRPFVFRVAKALPPKPTLVSATAGAPGEINLTWTDAVTVFPPDPLAPQNEVGFKLERATNNGFSQNYTVINRPANTTTYQNTGLTTGERYFYRVSAFNAAGTTAVSNVISVIAP